MMEIGVAEKQTADVNGKEDATTTTTITTTTTTATIAAAVVSGKCNSGCCCCRRRCSLPSLFERSAPGWWNPRFDSDILEDQHRKCSLPQHRRHVRYVIGYALVRLVLSLLLWIACYDLLDIGYWIVQLGVAVVALAILGYLYTSWYEAHVHLSSLIVAGLLAFLELFTCAANPLLTGVGTFSGSLQFLVILYGFLPLPLHLCAGVGATYSVAIEVMSCLYTGMNAPVYVACRAVLHLCVHVVGAHVCATSQARRRSTFVKVGQSIASRRDLQVEKQLKHNMIHSLMPAKVAEEVLRSRDLNERGQEEEEEGQSKKKNKNKKKNKKKDRSSSVHQDPGHGKMNFRTFHMSQMDDVSILFADIVGFTRMSSNKSAEHLVALLNDLFGRFDAICQRCHCEKISTLGDCYYCVSGCPEPRADHARCCVETGLAMCRAIREFDADHDEDVNMRVGVHTGTVLCGLVGTRRFKFDVWSHDVTLANSMESEGRPGCVHVSDCTYGFIRDDYEFEQGEDVPDIRRHKILIEAYNSETQQYVVRHVEKNNTLKTWFIVGRKRGESIDNEASDVTDRPSPPRDAAVVLETDMPVENRVTNNGIKETQSTGMKAAHSNVLTPAADDAKADGSSGAKGVVHLLQPKQRSEEADRDLVRCIRECSDVEDHLYHPPIDRHTLNFLDRDLESAFRSQRWQTTTTTTATATTTTESGVPRTLTGSPMTMTMMTSLLDAVVSFVFFVGVTVCSGVAYRRFSTVWIVIVTVGLLLELLLLAAMFYLHLVTGSVGRLTSHWYPCHVIGSLVSGLPTVVVFAAFSCRLSEDSPQAELFYCLLAVASLLHFCNFAVLSSLMKSSLATVAGVVLILFVTVSVCPDSYPVGPGCSNQSSDGDDNDNNRSDCRNFNFSSRNEVSGVEPVFSGSHYSQFELVFDVLLLLPLIWFLNREIEVGYRVCYHGDVQAVRDRLKITAEKEQADWLLHNIVPEHVADLLKHHAHYCRNHKDVGVIFAKISNFDDFYDESFEGGKEYLRVLNELIGDFEDLFDDPRFADVEKIKTIGSCLMAASGLNPQTRSRNADPSAHLFALVDFSVAMLRKLDDFNRNIFNFNFEMEIGYNYGEVTAGVVGTTKLLYDIWGDTVNIASRMYSTGVHGRIQVTEDTAGKLGEKFDFEYRGKTYVKGKGDMKTYLLVGKKPGASWN